MGTLTRLFTITVLTSTTLLAHARDLGPDEALKLRDAGVMMNFEKLNEAALARYPGGRIEDTELEQEHGRYVYQVEVRDAQGVQWDLELDAASGEILQERRDD